MDINELMHHGIPGMKWGVRRYQNRDGTLTAAGKKRYDKEVAKLRAETKVVKNKEQVKAKFDKLDAKRAALEERKRALDGKSAKPKTEKAKKPEPKDKPADPRKKPVEEMTDAELKSAVDRLVLENQYQKLNPPTVSKGKRFMQAVGKDVVAPALVAAGKKALTNVFDDAFGVVTDKMGNEIKKASKTTKKAVDKEKAKSQDDDEATSKKSRGNTNTKSKANTSTEPNRVSWVYDDDWWNTPGPRDSSVPALPPAKKKKKQK